MRDHNFIAEFYKELNNTVKHDKLSIIIIIDFYSKILVTPLSITSII